MGRWKDKPLETRLCKVCNEGLLEDEAHFLIHCEKYKSIRTTYLQEVVDETDCVVKGNEIEMMCILLSKPVLRISGHYIEQMWQERKDYLYNQKIDLDDDC